MNRRLSHRGFSFVELLFAVAVMGIGIIAVAGALYVGVDQTRATVDETTAAAIARGAAANLGQVMTKLNTLQTANAFFSEIDTQGPPANPPNLPALPTLVKPLQLGTADPRFAWVPVYHRLADAPTADVIIIVVRASARPEFTAADIASPPAPYPPGLVPVKLQATMQTDAATNETELVVKDLGVPGSTNALTPGAWIVLSSTDSSGVSGRVVRLSRLVATDTWALAPGWDLSGVPVVGIALDAFAVGRGYLDPAHPELGYTGANQAVAVYATTVLLR